MNHQWAQGPPHHPQSSSGSRPPPNQGYGNQGPHQQNGYQNQDPYGRQPHQQQFNQQPNWQHNPQAGFRMNSNGYAGAPPNTPANYPTTNHAHYGSSSPHSAYAQPMQYPEHQQHRQWTDRSPTPLKPMDIQRHQHYEQHLHQRQSQHPDQRQVQQTHYGYQDTRSQPSPSVSPMQPQQHPHQQAYQWLQQAPMHHHQPSQQPPPPPVPSAVRQIPGPNHQSAARQILQQQQDTRQGPAVQQPAAKQPPPMQQPTVQQPAARRAPPVQQPTVQPAPQQAAAARPIEAASIAVARQYDTPPATPAPTLANNDLARMPKFRMAYTLMQKRGHKLEGDDGKKIIQRSNILVTDKYALSPTDKDTNSDPRFLGQHRFVSFCKYNPLHVLDGVELEEHEKNCIDRGMIQALCRL